MSTMVFVNFPVTQLDRAIQFYTAIGFKQNLEFSNDQSAAMMWDDNFWIMLLTHEFYKTFIGKRTIADTLTQSGALIAFSLESADAVKQFGARAEAHGGTVYHVDMDIPESVMFGLEVQDPDGNMLEPSWMAMEG